MWSYNGNNNVFNLVIFVYEITGIVIERRTKMKRIYEKVDTSKLLKCEQEIISVFLKDYLPKSKHRALFELLEIERELTYREE